MKKTFFLLQGLFTLLMLPLLGNAQGLGFNGNPDNCLWIIKNRQTGQQMEIGGNYSEAQQTWRHASQIGGPSNNAKQWWYVTPAPGSSPNDFKIVNRFSGQLLEISSGNMASGTPAGQWYNSSNPGNHQIWTIAQYGQFWTIRNKYTQGYLRPSGSASGDEIVQVFTMAPPTNFEQWDMIYYSPAFTASLIRNVNSGKVLTAHLDDNKVTQWEYTSTSNISSKEWGFANANATSPAGTPCYYIFERMYQSVLEIGGGDDLMRAGHWANVWGTRTNQRNQKWWIREAGTLTGLAINQTSNKQVELVNLNSNQVLEIGGYANELQNNNQRANQWPLNNPTTPNQRWTIEYVSLNRNANSGSTSAMGQSDTFLGTTSLTSSSALSLSPVPARGELRITLPNGNKLASVRVTDVSGRLASVRQLADGQLDVSALVPGLYMLNASDSQYEYHQKFVKE